MAILAPIVWTATNSADAQNNADPAASAAGQAAHCRFNRFGGTYVCNDTPSSFVCEWRYTRGTGESGGPTISMDGAVAETMKVDTAVATEDPVADDTSRGEPVAVDAEMSMAPLEDEG